MSTVTLSSHVPVSRARPKNPPGTTAGGGTAARGTGSAVGTGAAAAAGTGEGAEQREQEEQEEQEEAAQDEDVKAEEVDTPLTTGATSRHSVGHSDDTVCAADDQFGKVSPTTVLRQLSVNNIDAATARRAVSHEVEISPTTVIGDGPVVRPDAEGDDADADIEVDVDAEGDLDADGDIDAEGEPDDGDEEMGDATAAAADIDPILETPSPVDRMRGILITPSAKADAYVKDTSQRTSLRSGALIGPGAAGDEDALGDEDAEGEDDLDAEGELDEGEEIEVELDA